MNCTVLSADNMECVICECTMYTQPSPATGGWVTANLPKYRQLTDSHPVRTRSMCLHSLRINFYVYSQFWQFYRLWPGRMVRAGSSRFPSGHQSFTSYRRERGEEGSSRRKGWRLDIKDDNFSLTPKYIYCISSKRILYILYISLAEETRFLKGED